MDSDTRQREMKQHDPKRYFLGLTARVALGCIFLASSLPKLRQPYDFLGDVYKYQLTGPALSRFVAMTLPFIELALGVCLLGGLILGGCFALSGLLSVMFAVAQGSALARNLPIACGCFGSLSSSETIGYASLIRVGVMLLASLTGLIAWRSMAKAEAEWSDAPEAGAPESGTGVAYA